MIPGTSTDLKRDLSASNVKAELPTELDSSHQSKLDEVKGESGKDFSSDFDAGQCAQGRRVAVRAPCQLRYRPEELGRKGSSRSEASSGDRPESRQVKIGYCLRSDLNDQFNWERTSLCRFIRLNEGYDELVALPAASGFSHRGASIR